MRTIYILTLVLFKLFSSSTYGQIIDSLELDSTTSSFKHNSYSIVTPDHFEPQRKTKRKKVIDSKIDFIYGAAGVQMANAQQLPQHLNQNGFQSFGPEYNTFQTIAINYFFKPKISVGLFYHPAIRQSFYGYSGNSNIDFDRNMRYLAFDLSISLWKRRVAFHVGPLFMFSTSTLEIQSYGGTQSLEENHSDVGIHFYTSFNVINRPHFFLGFNFSFGFLPPSYLGPYDINDHKTVDIYLPATTVSNSYTSSIGIHLGIRLF